MSVKIVSYSIGNTLLNPVVNKLPPFHCRYNQLFCYSPLRREHPSSIFYRLMRVSSVKIFCNTGKQKTRSIPECPAKTDAFSALSRIYIAFDMFSRVDKWYGLHDTSLSMGARCIPVVGVAIFFFWPTRSILSTSLGSAEVVSPEYRGINLCTDKPCSVACGM